MSANNHYVCTFSRTGLMLALIADHGFRKLTHKLKSHPMPSNTELPAAKDVGAPQRSAAAAWPVGPYFLLLLLVSNLGSPGPISLSNLPVQFLLKDQMKLGAE